MELVVIFMAAIGNENTQQTVSEKIEEDTDTLETKNEQKHDESDI